MGVNKKCEKCFVFHNKKTYKKCKKCQNLSFLVGFGHMVYGFDVMKLSLRVSNFEGSKMVDRWRKDIIK